jgi:hypothetical protein
MANANLASMSVDALLRLRENIEKVLTSAQAGLSAKACASMLAVSTDSPATPAKSSLFISSLPAVEVDKAVH